LLGGIDHGRADGFDHARRTGGTQTMGGENR
jgi:hypothetical protein